MSGSAFAFTPATEDGMLGRVSWIGVVAVVLAGCGAASHVANEESTDDSGSVDPAQTMSFTGTIGISVMDNFVREPGDGFQGVRVGDVSNGSRRFGLYKFDLAGLPSAATIQSATLRLSQIHTVGAPYTTLGGAIVVDHIDLGDIFGPAEMDSPAFDAGFATLSQSPGRGQRSIDVTNAGQTDVNAARTTTSLRLRFVSAPDQNRDSDYAVLEGVAGWGNTIPTIEVTYLP